MSKTLAGLANFKAELKRREEAAAERDRPKAQYFNWKNNQNKDDKNVVYVRFLQEFDKDVPGYDESRGLPLMAVEHTAPGKEGFKRRASCTVESAEGCYACERHPEDRKKGWGQKSNFYIWALVDYKDGEGPVPVVVSRSFGSTFVEDLIDEVEKDSENRITDKMFKIVKKGSGKDTRWKLIHAQGVELYDDTDVELLDLETAVLRAIPYEEQPAYFGAVYKDGDPLDNDDEDTESKPSKLTESGPIKW